MSTLLTVSGWIDALNERIGRALRWLILVAILVCTTNAIVRYGWNYSSNAWLELQWYLFAAVFLLGAPYTLKHDGHVRIDIFVARLSERAQAKIDIFCFLFFLLPISLLIVRFSLPYALLSWHGSEMSSNSGGLLRWPVKALIPLAFVLLILQGLSEVIKRVAFLQGRLPFSTFRRPEVVSTEITTIAETIQSTRATATSAHGHP